MNTKTTTTEYSTTQTFTSSKPRGKWEVLCKSGDMTVAINGGDAMSLTTGGYWDLTGEKNDITVTTTGTYIVRAGA